MHTLVICDRRQDLRSIASEVGIIFGAVQLILTDILGMSKVLTIWVPPMLTKDKKRTQLDVSRYLLSRDEDDPGDFIERAVTQDKTWVHHFDPSQKCRTNNGSTLAHPLLRNLRAFIQQGR